MNAEDISAGSLKARLDAGDAVRLLDVREPDELLISRLDGVLNIPLGELEARVAELDPSQEWVIICRSGSRSGYAAQWLRAMGFERVLNLAGGMNHWASAIDRTMPTY